MYGGQAPDCVVVDDNINHLLVWSRLFTSRRHIGLLLSVALISKLTKISRTRPLADIACGD